MADRAEEPIYGHPDLRLGIVAMGTRTRSFGDVIALTQDLQPRRVWYPDLLYHKDRWHKDVWGRRSRVRSWGWCDRMQFL